MLQTISMQVNGNRTTTTTFDINQRTKLLVYNIYSICYRYHVYILSTYP